MADVREISIIALISNGNEVYRKPISCFCPEDEPVEIAKKTVDGLLNILNNAGLSPLMIQHIRTYVRYYLGDVDGPATKQNR